ncbi:SDR family NAD(P)-dependent oxidoreductase [Prescottella agglutinans]|uniref:NAD(P)-dependent dehydrogenase (Short-subunit alcohol dehydrogenase family) n=1 Tax=Prescottella agglutinans TaxID=1644129 RepID=A0ABT6MBH0_9NOCA|nr:SDR family oxidoreductase [Prescottella agglutinans]MDH6281658.1 NAD(P)-dependent dehydrogenase (short-subunit alcohol dehydrogenase family) [Prescottella agglutinans]
MGKLEGKVALITGAGQGVGQGIAFALAKEGARIAVSGRTESKLIDTCEAIAAFGGVAEPVVADVSDAEDITRAVDTTAGVFGGVDILVNNASLNPLGPINDLKPDLLERAYTSGPVAALRTMQACYPHMKERGGGAIVNMVSSVAVRWDASGYGGYASVKEAVRALTRAAACEWGVDNIRVNAVAPHAMSPGLQRWTEARPEEAAAFVASIPMRRIGDPETDIGNAVAFLVGPDSGYLTGATIPLDGGQARWS